MMRAYLLVRNIDSVRVKAKHVVNIKRYTPIACYTTAPLYNIIIIFGTVVRQKRNFKHEKE